MHAELVKIFKRSSTKTNIRLQKDITMKHALNSTFSKCQSSFFGILKVL